MADLRLEKLTKIFPGKSDVQAVQDVSLAVNSGECVALLGPSGAGKSTILRLVAGLENPTSGEIHIDGRSMENTRPEMRELSLAFQYPALLPQLTVGENLQLGPKLRGHKDTDRRVNEISKLLGIGTLLSRKPETLSGGEQQRVALGRALIVRPKILLLDEPLASLDPLARVELREVIRRIHTELRLTSLYVTHDQAEAAAVADRIALLRNGTLQQFATARELYAEPQNLFVARFFGLDGLNLHSATISYSGTEWFATVGDARFPIRGEPQQKAGKHLAIAFRPSSIRIIPGRGMWIVKECRELGWTTVLLLRCGADEITCKYTAEPRISTGDKVQVHVAPERIHVFDLESGDRVPLAEGANKKPA